MSSRFWRPSQYSADQQSRSDSGANSCSRAPRPRGPKLKFTPEDDSLLVDLKENKSLTWKQIAEFFPGRSSGTLQVRYCTKLKAKTTQWTDETVRRLTFSNTDKSSDFHADPEASASSSRLRTREMAYRSPESRDRLHFSCVQRESRRIIAFSVSGRSGHNRF